MKLDENRLYIATSPLTGRIYAGQLTVAPRTNGLAQWEAKTDRTEAAIGAVIKHLLHGQTLGPDERKGCAVAERNPPDGTLV